MKGFLNSSFDDTIEIIFKDIFSHNIRTGVFLPSKFQLISTVVHHLLFNKTDLSKKKVLNDLIMNQ